MSQDTSSLRARFGDPPPPTPHSRRFLQDNTQILTVQFVIGVLVLCVLQPPFVMDFTEDLSPSLNLLNVMVVSAVAVTATVWLHRSFSRCGYNFPGVE
jgi:preprotein translocase subunit SecG